jgi:hypothetical protein
MPIKKPPQIPIAPMTNMIVVERIKVMSKLEKDQLKKDKKITLTKDQIAKRNQEVLDETKDVLKIWEEHPLVGIIVAIGDSVANETGYEVGQKVACRLGEGIGTMIIYNKKHYLGMFAHDVLFRYLTNEM